MKKEYNFSKGEKNPYITDQIIYGGCFVVLTLNPVRWLYIS
jgi:hypothetical protein